MSESKIQDIIITSLSMSESPLSSIDRNRLSNMLGVTRNTTYLLQRQRKLPPPISPPMGSKFWYQYEVDAFLLAMSDADIQPEEIASALFASRKNLTALIRRAKINYLKEQVS